MTVPADGNKTMLNTKILLGQYNNKGHSINKVNFA